MTRVGFTVLELVVSLIAATALMVGLVATLQVSMQSVDTVQQLHRNPDGELRAWLVDELRYATSVQQPQTDHLTLVRSEVDASTDTIQYRVNAGVLQRSVGGGTWITVDSNVTSLSYASRSYPVDLEQNLADLELPDSMPKSGINSTSRLCGVSNFESDSKVDEVTLEVPGEGRSGDLLVVAVLANYPPSIFTTPDTISIAGSGWNEVIHTNRWPTLRLRVWTRAWAANLPKPITIDLVNDYVACGTLLCVRNASSSPAQITDAVSQGFVASDADRPDAALDSAMTPTDLNVQIVASNASTRGVHTLGLAGFTDATNAKSSSGSSSHRTLYVGIRQGQLPATASTPRADLATWSTFIRGALRLQP